jgi:hypothetical protein
VCSGSWAPAQGHSSSSCRSCNASDAAGRRTESGSVREIPAAPTLRVSVSPPCLRALPTATPDWGPISSPGRAAVPRSWIEGTRPATECARLQPDAHGALRASLSPLDRAAYLASGPTRTRPVSAALTSPRDPNPCRTDWASQRPHTHGNEGGARPYSEDHDRQLVPECRPGSDTRASSRFSRPWRTSPRPRATPTPDHARPAHTFIAALANNGKQGLRQRDQRTGDDRRLFDDGRQIFGVLPYPFKKGCALLIAVGKLPASRDQFLTT